MPRATDSDLNKKADGFITFTEIVDCPKCGTSFDGSFPTEARDEDGLTDLDPDDFSRPQECPNCGHKFDADYTGWANYGDA